MLKCPRCGLMGSCTCYKVSHDTGRLSAPESAAYASAYLRTFQEIVGNFRAYRGPV